MRKKHKVLTMILALSKCLINVSYFYYSSSNTPCILSHPCLISSVTQTLFEQVPTVYQALHEVLGIESSTRPCCKTKAKSEDTAHSWPTLEAVSNPICSKGTDSQEETEMWSGTCLKHWAAERMSKS